MPKPLPAGTVVKVREEALKEDFSSQYGPYNTNEVQDHGWFYIIEYWEETSDPCLGSDYFYKCRSIATGVDGLGWYDTEVLSWEQTDAKV